ncbi:unnamed protein product [Rangifer tarandus platyrhynchus]|uniref:Uncharacterized protein n=2 Tax=Rangifer tarandus platyrhynchus TaxID=3082113 RepID=A0ACB0DWG6_RANTA|nr:unnamed protein product [Rangifer tarandus platyrhynchus]CAI9692533.1 unnamed protein product [Rangifer tarandus platyrhynchus]
MKKHIWDPQPGRETGILPVGRVLARVGGGNAGGVGDLQQGQVGEEEAYRGMQGGVYQTLSPMATRPARLPKYNGKKAARWKPPPGLLRRGRRGSGPFPPVLLR